MLETVDLNAKLDKAAFKRQHGPLDLRLAELQREVRAAGIPVVVVFEGWEAAGVGTAIGRILSPLDPRGYKVHTFGRPTETERLYPPMWRYWQTLPARGAIAVYDGSWYAQALDRGKPAKERMYERIRTFERQLTDDGTVLLKFWLHISKTEQAQRFKKLKKDPALAWKVTEGDWQRHHAYGAHCEVIDAMLRATSTFDAPWTVVPAHDHRFASLLIDQTLEAALSAALKRKPSRASAKTPVKKAGHRVLDSVDLRLSMKRSAYERELPKLQDELLRLEHLIYPARIPIAIVYEGWDASGKGGNIKRLVSGLDHRGFEVIPVGPPEGDEKTHHYLWRFWRNLPKGGHIHLFDRSWYGRVLVERLEGFARPDEWQRAYREINEFEAELTASGMVLVKFWIHISKEEQLRRFKDREHIEYKQWKITPDDWRNRKKWDAYYDAVSDMIELTSPPHAPWTIIEGNDKLHARIKALRTVAAAIGHALEAREAKKASRKH